MIRRALLALACLSLIGPLAHPAAGQEDAPPVTLELVDRGAWAGDGDTDGGDDALAFDVAVEGEVGDTTVRVRIHRALRDAAELTESLDGDVGPVIHASDPVPTAELPVVGDGTRRVEVTTEDLGDPGVHPVVIEIREPNGTVIDLVRTPAIRRGTDDEPLPAPTLALVVDVAFETTLTSESRRTLTEAELARAGRLATVLDDPDLPVTLVAVPDTLDALDASPDARAAALLDALAPAGRGRTTIGTPYVPTSARALVDAGLGDALAPALDAGAPALDEHVGPSPDTTVWPDDDVDAAAAELLAAEGFEHVLLSGHQPTAPDSGDLPSLEPLGPRPFPGDVAVGLSGVDIDDRTSAAVLEPAPDRADAAHVIVADLLLRDEGRGSSVAVRVDDVPERSRLMAALSLLTADDAPVALAPLDVPAVAADAVPVSPVPRDEPDLTPVADAYRTAADGLDTLEALVGAEEPRAVDLRLRLAAALGTDLDTDDRRALLAAVTAATGQGLDAIAITGQTDLNLTSRRGSLPVGVANDNEFPVRVMIRVRSDRLRFPEGEELLVDAEPGVTRIDVPVEALTTGSVPTFVELRSPDGTALLDDRQLNVRSTAFSGVGLAIGLGALIVLGVWWFRSWRRRRRDAPPVPAERA